MLVHGYAEHMGRYDELVSVLLEAGFDCQQFDLRGHGRSGGRRGYVDHFARYLDDLDQVLASMPPQPRIVLGHSLGGLISIHHVLSRPGQFEALALSSPFLAPTDPLPRWQAQAVRLAARWLPGFSVRGVLDAEGLSHDEAQVRRYRDDPLVFKTVNTRWFVTVRAVQNETVSRAPEIDLPTLLMIGEDDPVASPATSRSWFAGLASEDKRLLAYPGLLHEVFNEADRARVLKDLVAWLRERTSAPLPSPPAAH